MNSPHLWIPKVLTRWDEIARNFASGKGRRITPGTYLSDLITLRKVILLCWECNHKFYRHHKSEGYRLDPMKANATCDLCGRASETTSMYVAEEGWTTVHADHPGNAPGARRMYQAIPVRSLHNEDKAFLREKLKLK